jgi:hypothetical protein
LLDDAEDAQGREPGDGAEEPPAPLAHRDRLEAALAELLALRDMLRAAKAEDSRTADGEAA